MYKTKELYNNFNEGIKYNKRLDVLNRTLFYCIIIIYYIIKEWEYE